jgi:hypothetical protein
MRTANGSGSHRTNACSTKQMKPLRSVSRALPVPPEHDWCGVTAARSARREVGAQPLNPAPIKGSDGYYGY